MKTQPKLSNIEVINHEANQCVKCALCAPVCPTYQISHNENESPRGRIALAQALAQAQIPLTEVTRLHLDHCLSCRACEAVCPAGVKYGDLFDHTQAFITEKVPDKTQQYTFFANPRRNFYLRKLLRFYQLAGLQKLLQHLRFLGISKLQQLDEILPNLPPATSWQVYYPPITAELGRVALFLGCVAKEFDQATLLATIKVLTHIGYGVYLPSKQTCCGALALHAGQQAAYTSNRQTNQQAFANLPIQAIISVATGCQVVLEEYDEPLAIPVRDLNEFLLNSAWSPKITLQAYPAKVVLHTPCTRRNVLKQTLMPQQLLQRIPELSITLLPNTGCCGAAGSYFLRYPDLSKEHLENTLEPIFSENSSLLLTTNLGCQLQLHAGLKAKKLELSVQHPIVLLAQQIAVLP